jgi:hypothetical protein
VIGVLNLCICALSIALLPHRAGAQTQTTPQDPVAEAPIRLGVVGLAPAFTVSNLGIDTNVFNSVDNPQRDFTVKGSPALSAWMRTERGLLTLGGGIDLLYFQKFASERALNGSGSAKYEYRFNRLRPFVTFNAASMKERPGYEIDFRARRFDTAVGAGLDLRVASKSFLTVGGRRQQVRFAGDAVFDGKALNESLNRTIEGVDVSWRQHLTALTTWVVRASGERERYEFEPIRNQDTERVTTGFELGQFALIRGAAFIGYRHMHAAAGGTIREFSGLTSEVDVSYTAPSSTRLSARVNRDTMPSYDDATPYYVQTGWTVVLTQRLVGHWDFQLTGGRERLSYQTSLTVADQDRRDRVDRIGAGIGYELNDETRVSFDVRSMQRQSALPGRDYKAVTAGLSVTYAF